MWLRRNNEGGFIGSPPISAPSRPERIGAGSCALFAPSSAVCDGVRVDARREVSVCGRCKRCAASGLRSAQSVCGLEER
eukprot:11216770-Lingulodinium_polyedra.AAC.1